MLNRLKSIANSALTHKGLLRYFANASWMLGEQMLRMASSLLIGIWVARYLGPEQFGLFSYALAFVSIFSGLAKLGLDNIVVRDLVNHPQQRDFFMGTAFWLKFVGAFFMLGFVAVATLSTTNDHTTNLYVFIIASGICFQSFEVVDFYFQSKVLSKYVSICKITQLAVSSALKVYLVLTGADLIWFVVITLIDQVTLAVTLYLAYKYQNLGDFYLHFDRMLAIKMLKDGWPLIFSSFLVMIYNRIDQIMIMQMLGTKEVGIYSVAVRLSEAWYLIPIVITNSLFPAIVSANKISGELYYVRLQRLYTLMVWLAIVIALPISFLSDWIVVFLYGEAYRQAGSVLMINIWAGVFVFFASAWSMHMIANNNQKQFIKFDLLSTFFNIVLNLILIPRLGITGAAVATAFSIPITFVLFFFFYKDQKSTIICFIKALFLLSLFEKRSYK